MSPKSDISRPSVLSNETVWRKHFHNETQNKKQKMWLKCKRSRWSHEDDGAEKLLFHFEDLWFFQVNFTCWGLSAGVSDPADCDLDASVTSCSTCYCVEILQLVESLWRKPYNNNKAFWTRFSVSCFTDAERSLRDEILIKHVQCHGFTQRLNSSHLCFLSQWKWWSAFNRTSRRELRWNCWSISSTNLIQCSITDECFITWKQEASYFICQDI